MKFNINKLKLIAITIGAAAIATACTETSSTTGNTEDPTQASVAQSSGEALTIYSERSKDLVDPLIQQYISDTGNEVEVRYDDDLTSLINEEGEQTPADVFLSKSPGSIGILEENGHLAELPNEILSLVPETVQDDEGLWVGVSGRQRVLVYNSDLVSEDELPDSIYELTESRWNGVVGVAPNNGSFRDFVTAMRASEGEEVTQEWLNGLANNEALTYASNTPIVSAVGSGEIEVGLVNHYYNFRALAEDENHLGLNHQLDADDPGSFLMVAAATRIATSDQIAESEAFITWLLDNDAQTSFANETFEYPLASDVEPAEGVPAADFADVSGIDYQVLGNGLAQTQEMISEAGLRE